MVLQIQPKQFALEAYLESCEVLVPTSPNLLTSMTMDTCECSLSLYMESILLTIKILIYTSPNFLTSMTMDTCECSLSLYGINTIDHQDAQSYFPWHLDLDDKIPVCAVKHAFVFYIDHLFITTPQYESSQHHLIIFLSGINASSISPFRDFAVGAPGSGHAVVLRSLKENCNKAYI